MDQTLKSVTPVGCHDDLGGLPLFGYLDAGHRVYEVVVVMDDHGGDRLARFPRVISSSPTEPASPPLPPRPLEPPGPVEPAEPPPVPRPSTPAPPLPTPSAPPEPPRPLEPPVSNP